MTAIYFVFIVLPIIFITILAFIFSSSVSAIQVQQLKINCPYPINSGVASNVNSNGFTVTYNVTHDTSSSDYHVTVFHCAEDSNTSVTTTVYTASTSTWYTVAQQASGYMFYISQTITEFSLKIIAVGHLLYLLITAPAQVTGLAWFNYVNIILLTFIALGVFMVIRG